MKFLDKSSAITKMNLLGSERTPFIFITSFDTTKNIVVPLDEVNPLEVAYDFQGKQHNLDTFQETYDFAKHQTCEKKPYWHTAPISLSQYQSAFSPLMTALKKGTTDLANLTFPTPVKCNLTLPEIFLRTTAKYRIFLKDHFCAFSPETFITIENNIIATYPMKGTINATLPEAEKSLLEDPKEIDEHETVVKEALRDISKVAQNARVSKFRYIDRVKRENDAILQTSSIIEGDLPLNFHEQLGSLLFTLLPASSITGSPKKITTELLHQLETYQRGFYSGIAGIYDGVNLDSAVLIRYLEKEKNRTHNEPSIMPKKLQESYYHYTFKSGGGITAMSQAESEYDELIEKIYLPIS